MGSIVTGGPQRDSEAAEQPLSEKIAQGWEVQHYAASLGNSGVLEHCFYMRRQAENGVLLVRAKMMGRGLHSEWTAV